MNNSKETMSSSQKQKDAIKIACLEFRKGLESSLPLRHFSQFHEETMIRSAETLEKRNAVKKLMESIPTDCSDDRALVNELYSQMDKVIDEFLCKNAEHRNQTEAFFKKEIDFECEKFKMSLEAKLKINPEMDLKAVEELLESGKLAVASYFDHHWNHGNVSFFQEQKRKLNEKLDHLGQEMLKAQGQNLEDLKAKKFLEEVKEIVLEMSRQVKCYVDALEGKVSKLILNGRVQDIFDYLTGKGEVQNEKHRKVYLLLLGTVMHAMKFLGENEPSMSAGDLINWTDELDERLKFFCSENQMESHSIDPQQEESGPLMANNVASENENHRGKMDCRIGTASESSVSDALEDDEISVESNNEVGADSISQSCANSNAANLISNGEVNAVSNPVNVMQQNVNGQMTCGTSVHTITISDDESENAEAEKVFKEVKAIILEMSRQIKCYVDTHEGKVPKQVLKERTQNLCDYLDGKGYVLNEKYERIWSRLIGTAKAAVTVLSKAKENMSTKDCIRFAERLDTRLHSLCSENEIESSSNQKEQDDDELRMYDETNENGTLNSAVGKNSDNVEVQQMHPSKDNTGEETKKEDILQVGLKRGNQDDLELQATPLCLKRLRGMPPSEDLSQETKFINRKGEEIDLNVPINGGRDFRLLQAIRCGRNRVAYIKRMLDCGANVNVTRINYEDNAAHEVIKSIIKRKRSRTSAAAMEILNLLLNKGFTLINEKNADEYTPLFLAMEARDLTIELLQLFFNNGADFNFKDCNGKSVLMSAISHGRSGEIIQKLLEFGADPKYVDARKRNALHYAATYANQSAMEILIDQLDVNELDHRNNTPMHFLFSRSWSPEDCLECLEMLLRKGADFSAKNLNSDAPLTKWIDSYTACEPYEPLFEVRDSLPITQEIASAALTAMVIESGCSDRLKGNNLHYFAQLFEFFIEKKDAKLRFKEEPKWSLQSWEEYNKVILTRDFSSMLRLKTAGSLEWEGDLIKIEAGALGKLNFHTKFTIVSVPIEIVLNCLAACEDKNAFKKVCEFLYRSGMLMN